MGLQFQNFKSTKKIPMRLETLSLEEQKNHFFRMIGIEVPESKKKTKSSKSQTKRNTLRKNKTMKQGSEVPAS